MSLAYAVTDVVERFGATFTLRKSLTVVGGNAWTQGAGTVTYSTFRGHSVGAAAHGLRAGLKEGESLITVDAKTALSVPVAGDRVALGAFTGDGGAEWSQITNVYPVRESGKVRVYKLTVRR